MKRLLNSEGAAVERLNFVVLGRALEHKLLIVEHANHLQVVWLMGRFLNSEGVAVERLSFITTCPSTRTKLLNS